MGGLGEMEDTGFEPVTFPTCLSGRSSQLS